MIIFPKTFVMTLILTDIFGICVSKEQNPLFGLFAQVDFDDGNCPTYHNQIKGIHNVMKAVLNQLPSKSFIFSSILGIFTLGTSFRLAGTHMFEFRNMIRIQSRFTTIH